MIFHVCVIGVLCMATVRAEYSYKASEATTEKNGYVVESHDVTTADGYILGLKRIPYARNLTSIPQDQPVVFVMHGFGGQWEDILGPLTPELTLGYNLVDAGFDVWFGNARGNVHSRRHTSLNPDDPVQARQFFDFSWDDVGRLDLPAMIDYALNYTGKNQLHYIGGSQGGAVFLVMVSMRPEYNAKMASVHLLACAGYQAHFQDPKLATLAQLTDILYGFTRAIGLVEFKEELLGLVTASDGSDLTFAGSHNTTSVVVDPAGNVETADNTHAFGGASMKSLFHFFQNIRDKQFRRFHYGIGNIAKYGSINPPKYDLSLITCNITMHYGPADTLVSELDTLAMAKDMPNAVARRVASDTFGHGDFLLSPDAKVLVTDYIIESIKNVNKAKCVKCD